MKHTRAILVTTFMTLLSFIAVTYTACTKDPCKNVNCLNGGTCGGGNCTCIVGYVGTRCESLAVTTLAYQNDTYTDIHLVVNGSNYTIPAGGTVSFTGSYGDQLQGTATTSGTTTTADIIGLQMHWVINDVFPASGTTTEDMDVSADYFFLKITNNGPEAVEDVIVNYGTTAQRTDYITIPNDGYTYGIGYYSAYTNSNVKAESNAYTWTFNSLGLPYVSNQDEILTIQ